MVPAVGVSDAVRALTKRHASEKETKGGHKEDELLRKSERREKKSVPASG